PSRACASRSRRSVDASLMSGATARSRRLFRACARRGPGTGPPPGGALEAGGRSPAARRDGRPGGRPAGERGREPYGRAGSVEAELVALGVGHHDVARVERGPGVVAADALGAERDEAVALGLQGRHALLTL